jgi:hypothetical protein
MQTLHPLPHEVENILNSLQTTIAYPITPKVDFFDHRVDGSFEKGMYAFRQQFIQLQIDLPQVLIGLHILLQRWSDRRFYEVLSQIQRRKIQRVQQNVLRTLSLNEVLR